MYVKTSNLEHAWEEINTFKLEKHSYCICVNVRKTERFIQLFIPLKYQQNNYLFIKLIPHMFLVCILHRINIINNKNSNIENKSTSNKNSIQA